MRTATINVAPLAAIDESSDTVGFADSDLYGMTPTQIDAQLDQMQAMGVENVRVMIPWAGVEYYPGYYNWSTVDYMVNAADSRGMGVLGVINSTPSWATEPGQPALSGAPASPAAYGDFAGTVAARYAGKVGAYEIWNEPNSYAFYSPQPDPAGYTELLKAAYPQIKAADPHATVIGGVVG
ncbi:cellulase family glycosylhydrolase [Mycobacterium hodleri]|uniref:cellulase family glycosylhydrolase n=1 Tax=Mycolicibacterium hodleri TaxID=49897 RepID=UPI0021F35C9B|nr:cellulase family glycosylhydrolase [Mycolicibacterium hodleri]MCV7136537.1 cellulase family glycosylhydrolase [Mycolicibacterium hodleri]